MQAERQQIENWKKVQMEMHETKRLGKEETETQAMEHSKEMEIGMERNSLKRTETGERKLLESAETGMERKTLKEEGTEAQAGIPEWMQKAESYQPQRDADGFLTKSMMQCMKILTKAKKKGGMASGGSYASFWLFLTLYLILLISCSSNLYFHGCVLAGILIRLCLVEEQVMVAVCKRGCIAAICSALVLLPAVWMGTGAALLRITGKVWLSVSLLTLLTEHHSWNKLTKGLKGLGVPDLLILTLDLTLSYIVLLGSLCSDLLQALKLRSVGKNRNKKGALGGILGTTFLHAQTMAEETYQAMVCRGFEGTYRREEKRTICWWQVLILAGITAGYAFLEWGTAV